MGYDNYHGTILHLAAVGDSRERKAKPAWTPETAFSVRNKTPANHSVLPKLQE